jgi:hypothetical protein
MRFWIIDRSYDDFFHRLGCSRKLEHEKSRNPQFRLSGQALGLYGLLVTYVWLLLWRGTIVGSRGILNGFPLYYQSSPVWVL